MSPPTATTALISMRLAPATACPTTRCRCPPPAAGAGSVYRQATVNRGVIAAVLAVVASLLVGYVRRGRRP